MSHMEYDCRTIFDSYRAASYLSFNLQVKKPKHLKTQLLTGYLFSLTSLIRCLDLWDFEHLLMMALAMTPLF